MKKSNGKANKISQIVRLKQVMQRWKYISLNRDESVSNRLTPSGSLAVYVGQERRRFVIPTRFVNLPVFVSLLNRAEEEFGYQSNGGLVLPCEVELFERVVEFLERDEMRYGGYGLDEFVRMFSDVGFDSCKERGSVCGVNTLLEKTRV